MKKKAASSQGVRKKPAAPTPLLNPQTPCDWWLLFKFNSLEEEGFPKPRGSKGIFDAPGTSQPQYSLDGKKFSQQYALASSFDKHAKRGRGILGTSRFDPLGATFAQVYFGSHFYVVWNDQFYDDPMPSLGAPWGHSKGVLAWDKNGDGFVLQVTTPSWPASGNKRHPRKTDGNTLGFVKDDDIEVSQHFFSLKLNSSDIKLVLAALQNASVVTDPANPQLVNNGGPDDIQALVSKLGKKSRSKICTNVQLSSGVHLISKPSKMRVPPWQLVSAQLGGVDLRVATWWAHPQIFSTTRSTPIACWDDSLPGKPGAVDIAISGNWAGKKGEVTLDLKGGLGRDKNHAKFGVSTSGKATYSIFGDMNQQGALCPGYLTPKQTCNSSQNGRGGLFYVMEDEYLWQDMTHLLEGKSAPTSPPSGKTNKKKLVKKKAPAESGKQAAKKKAAKSS